MFATLTALVVQLAAVRWAIKTLVGVAVLFPVAMILKVVGFPVLMVLAVLALPVLLVLFVLGLPVFLVLIVGGLLLGAVFFALTMGLFALKIFLFVVLPLWLVWKVGGFLWRLVRPVKHDTAGYAGTQ